jgi:DNA (cytosine-5)-methyltransferase 1
VKKILAADLFCGAGGASTGFIRACELLGIDYELLAINHWQTAVDTHSANYPHVKHLCESVERVDPVVAVPGGRLHLLLAGPECTHFSTARGGRPVNPQSRASAWHILKWAQELYIDTILIENVPEFRTWGPVGTNGKPLKSKKCETYRAFLAALRSLGYKVEDRILNSADYGDPTTRRRLFIMARRGRHQVAWPTPTHSKTGSPTLFGKTKRWRAAREVIDWTVRGKSIFNRKKPLKPATIARILAGLEKFGGDALKPFLVILRNNQSAMSIDGPIPTLTTSGANVGIAEPFLMHITHGTDPDRTHSVDGPVPTVTGANRGEIGVIEPFVISAGGAKLRQPRAAFDPLPTVMGSDRLAVVESFVLPQHGGGALRPTGQPLPTIATDGAIAVVEPFIVPPLRFDPGRVESVDEPLPTITATGGRLFGLAQPFLVPFYTERPEEKHARSRSVDDPLPTITATGGGKVGVVEPFLTKYNRTATGAYSVNEPIDTISTRDRFGVVEPFLVTAGGPIGQGRNATSVDEPLPTVLAENHRAVVEPFIFANRTHNAPKSIDEPIPPLCTGDHIALVQPVIDGYVLDIHFRMLQPHELAAATSFPKSYVFTGTREDVVKQIGNSWTGELSFRLNVAAVSDFAPARKKKLEAIA